MRMVLFFFSFSRGEGPGAGKGFFCFFSLWLPMCSHHVPIKLPKCSQIWFPRCPTLLGAGCKEIANDSSWQKGKFWFARKWQWRSMKHKKIFFYLLRDSPFFPQVQNDPNCIKSWGCRVIWNTSVLWPLLELLFPDPKVYNLISAVFELCVTRVTSILKAKKAKGIHYCDSNYKLICIVQDFQQFLLSSSSFVLRSSIHWSVWKKGEFLLFGSASQVDTTF
jgi:hypothetical protein